MTITGIPGVKRNRAQEVWAQIFVEFLQDEQIFSNEKVCNQSFIFLPGLELISQLNNFIKRFMYLPEMKAKILDDMTQSG